MAAGPLLTTPRSTGGARGLRWACVRWIATAVALAGGVSPTSAQDPPPPPPDSLVTTLPDSARGLFPEPERDPQGFPARRFELRGAVTEVWACDADCLRASSAASLLDLIAEFVPGLTQVRSDYFAGPHYLMDGIYGASFAALYVDGREIPSLESAQVDMRRLSLVYLERVRVFRGPEGVIVDVDTYRHEGQAYSRIGGGTGDPQLSTLEGAFANGISDAFTFEGGFDLLDSEPGGIENDRFEALARLSWMPRSNDFGVQFEYRTESIDRTAADSADVRRRSALIRARGNVGERGQVELWGALSDLKDNDIPEPPEGEPDTIPRGRDADVAGMRASFGVGRGFATADARLSGGGAYASLASQIGATHPVGPFELEGGLDVSSWTGFSASSWRAGASFSDTLLVPFTIRAFGSSGDRGIGNPVQDTAEVVGYSQTGVSGGFSIGTFGVSGSFLTQKLDRGLTFGASWDEFVVVDTASVDVTSWEVRLDGPFIPLGEVISGLSPLRLRGFFRSNGSDALLPLYVPANQMRAEISLNDTFFDGNLEIWLSAYVERKGERRVPQAGAPDPVTLSSYMWPGGQLMFKIGDFRFFYRFANPAASEVLDIPGAPFPRTMGLFGIRWEFFN